MFFNGKHEKLENSPAGGPFCREGEDGDPHIFSNPVKEHDARVHTWHCKCEYLGMFFSSLVLCVFQWETINDKSKLKSVPICGKGSMATYQYYGTNRWVIE